MGLKEFAEVVMGFKEFQWWFSKFEKFAAVTITNSRNSKDNGKHIPLLNVLKCYFRYFNALFCLVFAQNFSSTFVFNLVRKMLSETKL